MHASAIPDARPFRARVLDSSSPTRPAVVRRRQAERHFYAWRRDRERAASGAVVATLVASGRLRPYDEPQLAAAIRSEVHRLVPLLIGYVLAAERAMGSHLGVIATHADVARWLDCSERTAGTVVRAAVACGLIEQRPWFWKRYVTDCGAIRPVVGEDAAPKERGAEGAAHLLPGPLVRAFQQKRSNERLRALSRAGKSCQPADQHRASHEIEGVSLRETVDCSESTPDRTRQGETAETVTWSELRAAALRLARAAGERGSRSRVLRSLARGAVKVLERRRSPAEEKHAAEKARFSAEVKRLAEIKRVEVEGVDDPELAALIATTLAQHELRTEQRA